MTDRSKSQSEEAKGGAIPSEEKNSSEKDPVRAQNMEVSSVIETLETERTSLVAVQTELEASRERYVYLYDGAPVGYVTLTRGGCITEINLLGAQMLGRPRNKLVQSPFIFFVADVDHRKCLSHLSLCRKKQMRLSTELELKPHSGGEPTFVEMVTLPHSFVDTGAEGFRCALVDITARKRAERELANAHVELERKVTEKTTLLELLPVGVMIGDSDCKRIFGNKMAYEIFDLPLGSNLSLSGQLQKGLRGIRNFINGKETKRVKDLPMQRVAATGVPLNNIRYEIHFPDGKRASTLASIAPVFDEHGKVQSVIGAYADVGARDKAERLLRAKDNQMRLIAEVAPIMLAHCTRDYRYSFVNQAYADFIGKPVYEIVGKEISAVVGKKAFRVIRPYVDRVLAGEMVDYEEEINYGLTGKHFMRVAYAPERNSEGEVTGWVAAILDTTESKIAENTLRESEERFRLLASQAPVGIFRSAPNGNALYVNDAWCAMTGLSTTQAMGRGWLRAVHPDDRAAITKGWSKAIRQKGASSAEFHFKRADGKVIWAEGQAVPVRDPRGRVIHFVGTVTDITERKAAEKILRGANEELERRVRQRTSQLIRSNNVLKREISERKRTEEALRQSEERFRLMVDGVQNCSIFTLDPKGNVTTWNEPARIIHGYRKEEILGKNFARFFLPEHLREKKPQELLRVAREVGRAEFNGWHVRKDGTRYWIDALITAVRDEEGRLRGFAKVTRDATDQRRAEEAAQESSARLQAIMDNSPALIFLKDTKGRYLHVNRRFGEAFNLPAEKILGKTDAQIFPKSQAQAFQENDRKVLQAGQPITFDERADQGDGAHTSIVTKFPLHDRHGKVYAIGGVATDITFRLREQEALFRSQSMLNDFFEQSPLALFWISPGGRIQRVNSAGLELLGCAHEDCVARSIADFHADKRAASETLRKLGEHELLENYRARLRRKDGGVRHVLIDANGLWDGKRFLYSRWFVRDISRRIELEQEILAAGERERQRISQDLHDDLCQQLAGVEFLSQSLAGQLAKGISPEGVDRAREIAGMVRHAINQTRELAHGLSPLRLEMVGMMGALRELVGRTQKIHNLDCQFHCSQPVLLPDPAWGIHLYRITQEAVSNAIKHGHCKRIDITFEKVDSTITLSIKDDGEGIPNKMKKPRGIGLKVMQYRAGIIGGMLTIQRDGRRGTTVTCTVKDDKSTKKLNHESSGKTRSK